MAAPVATRGKFDANKPAATPEDLKKFLEGNIGHIRQVAGTVMDPLRMVKIVTSAASRNPLLAKCTPLSILRCLVQGAELGLEVAGQLQEFHPVPFFNTKIGQYEAQGIPGFQGLMKLVKSTGDVSHIDAAIVYRSDLFDYERGLTPKLMHKPSLDALEEDQTDENILAFYAICWFKDGSQQFEVMGKAAVDKIRTRAQAKNKDKDKGPWVTDYAEMGVKTVLRKLCKRLPKTSALGKALEMQGAAESGVTYEADVLSSVAIPEEPDAYTWPTDALEAFDELMDRAYIAFKEVKMEAHWPTFENKWRPRRGQGDEKGLIRDLRTDVEALQKPAPKKEQG